MEWLLGSEIIDFLHIDALENRVERLRKLNLQIVVAFCDPMLFLLTAMTLSTVKLSKYYAEFVLA